jgi:hypothetical protein
MAGRVSAEPGPQRKPTRTRGGLRLAVLRDARGDDGRMRTPVGSRTVD